MARDLSFWKLDNTSENKYENREIYELLSAGEYVENISKLPSDAIRESFKKVFSDWVIEDNNFNNGSEEFELYITEQFVRTDCYSTTIDSMNKIIDIMLAYNCPMYDSIIDIRFDE